jgi:ribonuclease HI
MVKVKAHRGEPLNEKADTQAESARQLPQEHRQWTTRTQTMAYEWRDNHCVMHVTAWSKAVRNAMLRGGAEHQMQRALNRAVDNWIKIFMSSTDSGLQRIKQAANTGAQSDGQHTLGVEVYVSTSGNGQLEKTGYHNMGGRVSA